MAFHGVAAVVSFGLLLLGTMIPALALPWENLEMARHRPAGGRDLAARRTEAGAPACPVHPSPVPQALISQRVPHHAVQ